MSEIILSEQQAAFIDLFKDALELEKLAGKENKPQLKLCVDGYAGTGKSVLIDYIVKNFKHLRFKIITYTNKAVTVLQDKGIKNPSTIHKFLYTLDEEEFDKKKGDSKLKFKVNRLTAKDRIKLKIENKAEEEFDWIVLDECSMIDAVIKKDIESLGFNVLVFGDSFQIPPIAEDKKEVQKSPFFTDPDYTHFKLTEVLRYDGPILSLSIDIRNSKKIPYHTSTDTARFQKLPNDNILLGADVVIVGTNKQKVIVNNKIRLLTYNISNPYHPPIKGERIIVNRSNSLNKLVNSDILEIVDDQINLASLDYFDPDDQPHIEVLNVLTDTKKSVKLVFTDYLDKDKLYKFRVHCYNTYSPKKRIPGEEMLENPFVEVSFSKCMTAHKTQGSEYEKVLVIDQSFIFKGMESQWLYSCITRAKSKLIIVDKI